MVRTPQNRGIPEEAIAEYYGTGPVALTPERILKSKAAIRALAEVSQGAVRQVQDAKSALILKLKAQQRRLIRLYAEEGEGYSPDAGREERARIQAEITAAEQSLAETTARMQIAVRDLETALELVEDIKGVYLDPDEPTRRGYNQAFFKKLRVRAEWDEATLAVRATVTSAELTEPYALLLAEDLVEGIEAEISALDKAKRSREADQAFLEALGSGWVSYFEQLAGRRGRNANPESPLLGRLIQALMEPAGREARRRAAEIIAASLRRRRSSGRALRSRHPERSSPA